MKKSRFNKRINKDGIFAPFSSVDYPVPFATMFNDLALKKKKRLNTILDVLRKRKEKEQG